MLLGLLVKTVSAATIDNVDGVATLQGLEGVFQNLISTILSFAGIALFIVLLVGGFKYITSGGNPQELEGAKKTITYAIGGVVLLALSYLILVLIKDFTGVDVTQFQIYRPSF